MIRASVLLLAMTATAFADGDSSKLFEEGRALAKDGKWDDACDRFAASFELDHAIGTELNLADCHEHLGHLAQAWRLFDEAARTAETAERGKFARARADELLPQLATIVVKVATPGAPGLALSIAGRISRPAAEVHEVVDPGDVQVEASAPNMHKVAKSARAQAGETVVVEIPALAEDKPVIVSGRTERRPTRVVAAYTLGGIGAASFVTGVLLGYVAKRKYDDAIAGNCEMPDPDRPRACNPEGYRGTNSAIMVANVGTVVGTVGVAMVAAAAVVYFTAPRDVVVTPTASTQSAGLAVVGRF